MLESEESPEHFVTNTKRGSNCRGPDGKPLYPMVEIEDGGFDDEGNPIQNIWLNLHDGQRDVMDSTARFTAMLSGTQGGKTSLGPWWLRDKIEEQGAGDYLAITGNFDLFKLKMLPEMLKTFRDTLGVGRLWDGAGVIELRDPETEVFWARKASDPMWGRIILRSAQAGKSAQGSNTIGVRGLESATAKAAWLDECGLPDFTVETWESILRRLSLSQGPVLMTTTLYNFGWLREKIYIPSLEGNPDINVIQFDSMANPAFPEEEYYRAKASMPAWKFNMQYRGMYDKPAGAIYTDFTDEVHVIDPFFIPNHWPVFVGIDPGAVNTALVYLAKDPDSLNVYLWKETLEGDMTTKQHVEKAMTITDRFIHADWYGGAPSEKQFRMDWRNEGITVKEPKITDVEGGIDRVVALLRSNTFRIFRTCPKTIAQMSEYARVLDNRGEPTEKIQHKEIYHLLDALRYVVPAIPQMKWHPHLDNAMNTARRIPGLSVGGMGPGGFHL